MKRILIRSPTFIRAAKRALKKWPHAIEDVEEALKLLSGDAFHAKLKTHKLKGKLVGSWACSAGYDLRIVLRFGQYEGKEAIFLETIGTHEEVY